VVKEMQDQNKFREEIDKFGSSTLEEAEEWTRFRIKMIRTSHQKTL